MTDPLDVALADDETELTDAEVIEELRQEAYSFRSLLATACAELGQQAARHQMRAMTPVVLRYMPNDSIAVH